MNDVILNDKYKTVIDVWEYLRQVSETELLQLCKLNLTYRLSDIVAKESIEYKFLGFLTQAGQGSKLADWCKSRNGQIIVCENTKATWMEFKPLVDMTGKPINTREIIFCVEKKKQLMMQKKNLKEYSKVLFLLS